METASDRTFRWILEDGFDEKLGEDDLKSGDNGRNSAGDNFEDPEDTRSDKSEKEKPATHMKKKERGETDEEKQRRIAKENRVKARAKFTTWLERDGGGFHISGKPGSGKSTLMKFIHGQPETIERLIVWAGNKQLVFGHFFFFKAGGKLQKSLEGLQRSILFEALKQCPELIKHVFPEAYRAFSSNPAASSIDELYFRPRELDQAINMLASVPKAMGYRICFFIDGLDEYEDTNADELHHERLAEQLCSWATNSYVKILVSSRPYRAFQEAFLDERRIRIQDLTDIDITLFARKMFEEDKSFDQVGPYYQRLVNKVVQDSAGVFLWACLTMRSLIMATRRNCSPKFLEQQLDQTPRSINTLYAQLLASINPIDRDSAYRLLLFVARLAEADVEVLALALTWMDSLENPNFPMCSEPRAYTTEEVELRRNSVRQDLENCTKGLLEITTYTDSSCRSTTDKVRFFHRTILDFVRESEVFRQVSAKYPGLGDEKMTIRMFLAELWYIKIPHRRHELLNRHFGRMPPSQTRDNYLDALERVVSYHNANGTMSIGIATHHPYGYSHMYRQQTSSQMCRTKASFLHWAASILDDLEYVIKKLKEKPHLLHHRDYLSLVLSATFSNETRWSDTRLTPFFQLGISPNERINVYKISFRRELLSPKSCWAVFCTFYAMHNTGRLCESDRACYLVTQLEDFLSTGEVDINCVILLNTCGDGWRWRYHDDEPEPKEPGVTHYIYLKNLISRLSSDNHVAISHLVSASNWSLWKSLKNIWSYSPPPENDLSALTSTYPVCDDELLFSKETHVVSLVWENEKIERTDFEITLY